MLALFADLCPGDEVIPFSAWHSAAQVDAAYRFFAIDQASRPHRLPLPRPLLYEAWHRLGTMAPTRLSSAVARADIVHAPSPAVPPRGKRPLVVTVHDAAFALHPEAYPARGRRFHEIGVARAAHRADLVITVSHSAAAEIVEHTAVRAEKLRVVHSGVDQIEAEHNAVAATRNRLGLDRPYVLWVGSDEPRKDVGTLLAAFARITPGGEAATHDLVLVGPRGWLGGGAKDEDDLRRIGNRLRVLGPVDDATLRCLYAGADLFAFPSKHEGFGLPVIEAMVQRTPVLCSDIPALVEVTGGAAMLAPPGDVDAWSAKLAHLLGEADELVALATAGRERAKQFTWEKTVAATRAVYLEALGA